MYNYKPTHSSQNLPRWKQKEQEDNRMIWAAIGLGWVLLCLDALTKI